MKKFIIILCLFFTIINNTFSQAAINEDDYITVLTPDLDSLSKLKINDNNLILDESLSRQIKDRIISNLKTSNPKKEKNSNQEKSAFSLSLEPMFGMKWGQIDEYVFSKRSYFSQDKLSELNWEIKPEIYYGIKLQGGWLGIFGEGYFSAGIPAGTGGMMDSDWQNIELAAASGGNTVKTNYSESDNYMEYDICFGFKGGYTFQIFEIFKIKPAIAFEYQNIKFKGKNGKGWYGNSKAGGGLYPYNDTDHQTIHDWTGKDVIGYKRVSDILWLGSDFSADLPANFSVTAGFFFAPYVYAVSYDEHLLKNMDYADLTTGVFSAFKWNLGTTYKFNKHHSISINAAYFYMKLLRGDDYQKSSSAKTYTKSTIAEGGAGADWFDLSISYRFTIF